MPNCTLHSVFFYCGIKQTVKLGKYYPVLWKTAEGVETSLCKCVVVRATFASIEHWI